MRRTFICRQSYNIIVFINIVSFILIIITHDRMKLGLGCPYSGSIFNGLEFSIISWVCSIVEGGILSHTFAWQQQIQVPIKNNKINKVKRSIPKNFPSQNWSIFQVSFKYGKSAFKNTDTYKDRNVQNEPGQKLRDF